MEKKNRISIKLDNTWEKPYSFSEQRQSSETSDLSLASNLSQLSESKKPSEASQPSEWLQPSSFTEQQTQTSLFREWPLEEEPFTSPTLPFSHYQKRQRKQRNSWNNPSSSPRRRGSSTRRKRRSIGLSASTKLVFTIASAVGLGLVMGMMVLNIFSNLNEDPVSTSSVANEQRMEQSPDQGGAAPEVNQGDELTLIPSGTTQGNSVQLPARAYYVVQAGAFTEKTMADEGLHIQQQQGWAGILLGDEAPYRLYAGLATSKDEAILLGQFYREKNMDIYVREHQTDQLSGAVVALNENVLSTLPSFITKGDQLLAKMGSVSAKGIMNPSESLSSAEWHQLQELHRSFLEEGQALFNSWPEKGKAEGERLLHQLTEGMNALDAYHKQKHTSYLWKVQQALLHYIETYEQFIAALSTAG